MKKNKIVIVCGAGGSGKTSVCELLDAGKKFIKIPTTTSRDKRPSETEGKEYFFIDKSQFEQMIKNNEFLEWVEFNGNYYGTSQARIFNALQKKHCVLALDLIGATKLKKMFPDNVITVYIYADLKELKARLMQRGDKPQDIVKRLALGKKENAQRTLCDYVVHNKRDKLDKCVQTIIDIVEKESSKN